MENARPKIINSYYHQIADSDKNGSLTKPITEKLANENISESQEEYLVEARANLARSLDEARAEYLRSGKPLLTIEELDAEIAEIRG